MKSKLPLRVRIWRRFYFPIMRSYTAREGAKLDRELSDIQSIEDLAVRLERMTESNYRRGRRLLIGIVIVVFMLCGVLSIAASLAITRGQTAITDAEWLQGILAGIGVEAIGAVMTFIVIEVVWIRWDSRREKRYKTEMKHLQKLWDLAYPDDKPSYTNFRTPPPED